MRLILAILLLGFALGYSAQSIKQWLQPGQPEFDSTRQLLDEAGPARMEL